MEEYGINFQEPPPNLIKGEEEWEVEQILDECKQGQTQQYLIRWKGYSSTHDSWEPITGINAPDLISAFHKQRTRVKRVQKDRQGSKEGSNTAQLQRIVMSSPIRPPSSCDSNERTAWYVEYRDIPHTYDTPSPPHDSLYAIDHLPLASPEPLMIPPVEGSEDIGPSVSEHASPNRTEDILMETQSVGNNFEETIQLFQEVDQELDAALHLSPSVFNNAPQLGIRSAGPPKVTEENLAVVVEECYTPRTSTPVELKVGEGSLPLEPANSTDEQSTDTQISSHALHPGYPWTQYTPALHGTPMTMPSMDENFPFRTDYVAYEVEPHHGDPTIYLTVGDGHPAYQHLLMAEPSNEPSMNIQPANLLLFHERFQTEPVVNRALEALGDRGVSADVLRLRQFPGQWQALQEMKNQITQLEDFILKEHQRYLKQDQALVDEEKEVRD